MKKNINLTRKFIMILLVSALLMYVITGRSYADDIINLDSLETIEEIETTTESNDVIDIGGNTATETNNVVQNNVTTNSSSSNQTTLPETGSNTEIIFIIGVTVLAGTAIYVHKKSKIK